MKNYDLDDFVLGPQIDEQRSTYDIESSFEDWWMDFLEQLTYANE